MRGTVAAAWRRGSARPAVAAAVALLPAAAVLAGAPGPAPAQEGDTLRAEDAASPAPRAVPPLEDTLRTGERTGRAPSDTLSLREALAIALAKSPGVRSARASASAEASARWADWGAFLPRASASMSLSRLDRRRVTFVTDEGFSARLPAAREGINKSVGQSVSFDWTILEGGRRIADLQAGGAAARAARLRLSEAERRTAAEVKQAYFEARKQERLVRIARQQLESRRRELEQTRRRYRIAAVDRADLLGAQVEVRQAELNLLESRDAAKESRRRLRTAMGARGEGAPADVALGGVPPPPDPGRIEAGPLVERALASHPEMRALQAEAEGASARVWGARSTYLPTIRAGFRHSRSEELGPEGDLLTFDPRNRDNSFSVTASWELFTGFQRKEQNARASAELQRLRAERARRRLEIETTVRDLVDEVERRSRRVELLREQLRVAEERLDLLSEQYRLGSAGFDQLQRAIDEVTRAERDVVRERYDYLSAWARLERWAGDVAPGLPSPGIGSGSGSR